MYSPGGDLFVLFKEVYLGFRFLKKKSGPSGIEYVIVIFLKFRITPWVKKTPAEGSLLNREELTPESFLITYILLNRQ